MSAAAPRDDRSGGRPSRRALVAVAALAAVPWSVQTFGAAEPTLLFPWGLVGTDPLRVTTLSDYLFRYTAGLPEYILAWPLGVALWAAAAASAAVARVRGRGDPRVTAGLLVLAGATQLSVAVGFSAQPSRTAYPTGTLALWAAAWVVYRSRLRGRSVP